MRILIAPDKFKGSMSAGVVAGILDEKLRASGFETQKIPIADGGEGTTEVLSEVLGGQLVSVEVADPFGETVTAKYAVAGDLAILEMSEASGLWRIPSEDRDPWLASTFGTGQMMRDSIQVHGVKRILIGIGGSATNDGGAGLARALGFQFLDRDLAEVTRFPVELDRVANIRNKDEVVFPEIQVACDVSNPLLGQNGATRVYGPQKGVREADFAGFENRLAALANLVERDLEKSPDLKNRPGAGAAGGLGFGLMAFCGAELRPGFELIADLIGLKAAVSECDLIITGEGNLDRQTLNGKGPHGVAQMARRAGKPVLAVVGDFDDSPEIQAEFDRIVKIRPNGLSVADSIQNGPKLLRSSKISEAVRALAADLHMP